MELNESVDSINRQLREQFGIDSDSTQPIFRIVFSDEQLEKRLVDHYNGVALLTPEVKEVPKYSWIKARYVLERLVVIPVTSMEDLPCAKLSYEPLWIFENQSGDYLPPKWEASKLIIDTMYAAMGKSSLRKYIDEEEKNPKEVRDARIAKLQEELFGNETPATDALAYKQGVVVPHNYGDKQ